MPKIIGNTTATPNPRPDWAQTDELKADYIRNKPKLGTLAAKSEVSKTDLAADVQASLGKADSAIQSIEGLASETDLNALRTKVGEIPAGATATTVVGYVDEKVADMVNSAPETLDTLNELATALGNDPNFATTVATQIGLKADKNEIKDVLRYSEQTLTDEQKIQARANIGAGNSNFSGDYNDLENQLISLGTGEGAVVIKNSDSAIAEGAHSFVAGTSTRAIGENAYAVGNKTIAGTRGYYWKAIDLTNKKIYITTNRVVPSLTENFTDEGFDLASLSGYAIGDKIAIVNNNKYYPEATITSIDGSVITYTGDIGFTAINAVASDDWDIDDYCFYVVAKPEPEAHIEVSERICKEIKRNAYAEGTNNTAQGTGAHAEGRDNNAYGDYSHSEGRKTKAAWAAHSEGYDTDARGFYSHTEGRHTVTGENAEGAHAEGRAVKVTGYAAHGEGIGKLNGTAVEDYSLSSGRGSHVEGVYNKAIANGSHAEGEGNTVSGANAHVEGQGNTTVASYSHVEGGANHIYGANTEYTLDGNKYTTKNASTGSHIEGESNKIYGGLDSHVEGKQNTIYGRSGASGYGGSQCHIEGINNKVTGDNTTEAHVEGRGNTASAAQAHAEGQSTVASAPQSHAGGLGTKATETAQTAIGRYNVPNNNALFIVGNGESASKPSNAFEVLKNGEIYGNGKQLATLDIDGCVSQARYAYDAYTANFLSTATNVGSKTNPVYFVGGIPVACSTELPEIIQMTSYIEVTNIPELQAATVDFNFSNYGNYSVYMCRVTDRDYMNDTFIIVTTYEAGTLIPIGTNRGNWSFSNGNISGQLSYSDYKFSNGLNMDFKAIKLL